MKTHPILNDGRGPEIIRHTPSKDRVPIRAFFFKGFGHFLGAMQ